MIRVIAANLLEGDLSISFRKVDGILLRWVFSRFPRAFRGGMAGYFLRGWSAACHRARIRAVPPARYRAAKEEASLCEKSRISTPLPQPDPVSQEVGRLRGAQITLL